MAEFLPLPWLLVATQLLEDSPFRESVLLMTQHSGDGSVGFIINRPLRTPLADVIIAEGLNPALTPPPSVPVWEGGPVGRDVGLILSDQTAVDARQEAAGFAFSLSASAGALAALAADALAQDQRLQNTASPTGPLYRHRFLTGYAGWAPGQLASEIRQGSWLQLAASWELVFATDWRSLWELARSGSYQQPVPSYMQNTARYLH